MTTKTKEAKAPNSIHWTLAVPPPIQRLTRKMKTAPLKLALSACLLIGGTAHAVILIQNGSFEAPVQPGTGYLTGTPADWTGGAYIFQGTVSDSFGSWPSPEDGIQFAHLGIGSDPALTQVVHIPLAGSYILTWFENECLGYSHTYEVLLNGNVVANPSGVGSLTWTAQSEVLNLDAGDNTLAFQGLGGTATLIDNVRLEAQTVPDASSTFCLLSMALGGIAALQRRVA